MRKFLLCLIFALPFAFSYSQSSDIYQILEMLDSKCFDSSGSFSQSCQYLLDSFNFSIASASIPDHVFSLFGNKKINLSITTDEKNYLFFIKTSSRKIEYIKKGSMQDAEMFVETSLDTVFSIAYSNDKVAAFTDALADGRITYKEKGILGGIKTFAFNIVSFLAGIFKAAGNLIGLG